MRGINRLPEIADVPYLDIVAAESEGGRSLVLLCVNRNLTKSLLAKFDFAGMGVKEGTAKVATLAADNILTENDEEEPERVKPVSQTEPLRPGYTHKFPAASVTMIEIPLQ